jgi:hypothetical protein
MLLQSIRSSNGILNVQGLTSGINSVRSAEAYKYLADSISFVLGAHRYEGMQLPIKKNNEECEIALTYSTNGETRTAIRRTNRPDLITLCTEQPSSYIRGISLAQLLPEEMRSDTSTTIPVELWINMLLSTNFAHGNDVRTLLKKPNIARGIAINTDLIRYFVGNSNTCVDNIIKSSNTQSDKNAEICMAMLLGLRWEHPAQEEYEDNNVSSLTRYRNDGRGLTPSKYLEKLKRYHSLYDTTLMEITASFRNYSALLLGEYGKLKADITLNGYNVRVTANKISGKYNTSEEHEHDIQLLRAAFYLAILAHKSLTNQISFMVGTDTLDLLTDEEFDNVLSIVHALSEERECQFIYVTRA